METGRSNAIEAPKVAPSIWIVRQILFNVYYMQGGNVENFSIVLETKNYIVLEIKQRK